MATSTDFKVFLNESPNLNELRKHLRIGDAWLIFGEYFDLDSIKLEDIRRNNESIDLKTSQMFQLLLNTKPNVRRIDIIEALKSPAVAKNSVASVYEMALKEDQDQVKKVLQKESKTFSQQILPSKVTQLLYTEGVISKETFTNLERSGGLLADGPLKELSSTIVKDPNKFKIFLNVLLKSEETVQFAKDALKEYVQTIYIPPHYQQFFDEMKGKFGKLLHIVAPLLKSAVMSSQEISSSLDDLKKFLGRCFRELKPKLSIAESFDDVMDIIEERCTIINIYCLENVINQYNVTEAECHIETYKKELKKFCEEVKPIIQNLMKDSFCLLKCETIKFVLDWKTDEHTLIEIRYLLCEAFGDMAKRILVEEATDGNSIIVTCYAPQNIIDILVVEAKTNLDQLKRRGVITLTIGYHTIWNARKYLEANTYEDQIVAIRNEKESEITKLKSILKKKEGTKIITLRGKSYCHSLLNTEEMIQKQIEMDELKSAADKEIEALERELKYEKQKSESQQMEITKLKDIFKKREFEGFVFPHKQLSRHQDHKKKTLKLKFNRLLMNLYDFVNQIDVTNLIQTLLITQVATIHADILEEVKLQKTSSDAIICLKKYQFITYLKPQLLHEIVERWLLKHQELMTQMNQYMKDYEEYELTPTSHEEDRPRSPFL